MNYKWLIMNYISKLTELRCCGFFFFQYKFNEMIYNSQYVLPKNHRKSIFARFPKNTIKKKFKMHRFCIYTHTYRHVLEFMNYYVFPVRLLCFSLSFSAQTYISTRSNVKFHQTTKVNMYATISVL